MATWRPPLKRPAAEGNAYARILGGPLQRYTRRQHASVQDANLKVKLRYGITAKDVVDAVNDLYAYLHAINKSAIRLSYGRLEESMLPAAFSGFISETMVQSFAHAFSNRKPGLVRNRYPNGHPDLIPRAKYRNDSVLSGTEGIEIKTTRSTSVQSHNERPGSLIVVEILCDLTGVVHERLATSVLTVRYGALTKRDWKFYPRKGASRRTITAAILPSGKKKLFEVYNNPLRAELLKYIREKKKGERP